MKQQHSWEIIDAFREAAKPLIPKWGRETAKEYRRKPGGGRPPRNSAEFLRLCSAYLNPMESAARSVWSGKLYPPAVPVVV
jgi:hypothetical protein